jgi:hypothetical protein
MFETTWGELVPFDVLQDGWHVANVDGDSVTLRKGGRETNSEISAFRDTPVTVIERRSQTLMACLDISGSDQAAVVARLHLGGTPLCVIESTDGQGATRNVCNPWTEMDLRERILHAFHFHGSAHLHTGSPTVDHIHR